MFPPRPPRGALGFFLRLDAVHALVTPAGVTAVLVGEHVGMTSDHFSCHRLHDVTEGKRILLLGHAGVVNHLQQEIAEFIPEVIEIAAEIASATS